MKHYLLSLAAATLMAGAAQAQVAPLGSTRAQQAQFAPSLMLNKGGLSLKSMNKTVGDQIQLKTRATRADEFLRDPKELSYQSYGNEANSVSRVSVLNFSTLAQYGFNGFGFASAYYSDMLTRYGQNKISKISFIAYGGRLTNGIVFIMDGEQGTVLWAKSLDTIEAWNTTSTQIPVNEVECDYTLTGNENVLLIGWVADARQLATDQNKDYVVLPCYMDNSGSGQGGYLLGKSSQGSISILDSAPEVYTDASRTETCMTAAWILVDTEGEGGLNTYDAANSGLPQSRVVKGSADYSNAQLYLTNMGIAPIKSFDYTYQVDGKTMNGTVELEKEIPFYASEYVPFQPLLAEKPSRSVGQLTITGVNGEADEYPTDNAASGSLVTLEDSYNRTPVIEEFTSNSCGWCPSGLIYMSQTAEAMAEGEGAVLIAVHTNYQQNVTDPLTAESYAPFVQANASAFPSAVINRESILLDLTQLPTMAAQTVNNPVEASMKLKSELVTDASGAQQIKVTTDLNFALDAEAGQYGVAYVVTEDNINSVRQLNYYASNYNYYSEQGISDAEIMAGLGWTDEEMAIAKQGRADASGNYWYTPTFDHAAVYINDIAGTGAASQLPAIKAGEPLQHTATFDLPTRTSPAVNVENLQIAALLIDQTSGCTVTARQAKLGAESTVSAIDPAQTVVGAPAISVADGAFSVQAANATAQVFDAAGKLVSSATVNGQASLPTFGKGVYVIRVVSGGNVFTQKAAF